MAESGPTRRAAGRAEAPPSKSHALRALVAAALAQGSSRLLRVPDADDVRHAARAVAALGVGVDVSPGEIRVRGAAGKPPLASARLDVGGSATGLRLLAAVCALGPGPYVLTGDATLLGRPFGALAPALERLGATVVTDGGRPPVTVSGGPVRGGRDVEADAGLSSHPLSALLLVAPCLPGGLRVVPAGGLVASRPYVDLTLEVMRGFGARAEERGGAFRVAETGYAGREVEVEGDWSSAAFLLSAAALTRGDVTVSGLRAGSVQADRRIVDVLRAFGAAVDAAGDSVRVRGGALRPVDVDLGACPDLAPVVGALACAAPGTSRVRGAPQLRIKESDRVAAVVAAARALGCAAEERPDGFVVTGGPLRAAAVDPRGDHRLAMAFGVLGLALPGLEVQDRGCVAKSFPGFWDALERLAPR